MRYPTSLALTLGVLAAANVLSHRVIPQADAAVSIAMVGSLAAVAGSSKLVADDLGLARAAVPKGLRWGGAAAAVTAAVYGIGALIPAVRQATALPGQSWATSLLQALVVIPLATVIPEEFAFRGVLWGLLNRQSGRRLATGVSAFAFGLWHVLPALGGGAANESAGGVLGGGPLATAALVVGTVVFTGLGGVVLAALRARSGSLLAPILLHWAINGVGVIFLQLAAMGR
ncbi:MAG: CPBP family intramembrane glutamic endopeptidase [Nakamurella sp.]